MLLITPQPKRRIAGSIFSQLDGRSRRNCAVDLRGKTATPADYHGRVQPGRSSRQFLAIAEQLQQIGPRHDYGRCQVEGRENRYWVLIRHWRCDRFSRVPSGSREFYQLSKLWQ